MVRRVGPSGPPSPLVHDIHWTSISSYPISFVGTNSIANWREKRGSGHRQKMGIGGMTPIQKPKAAYETCARICNS